MNLFFVAILGGIFSLFSFQSSAVRFLNEQDMKRYLLETNQLMIDDEEATYQVIPFENQLSLVNTQTGRDTRVLVGRFPVCLEKASHFLYVLNYDSSTISVVDIKLLRVVDLIFVPKGTHLIKISTGGFGYAVDFEKGVTIFKCPEHTRYKDVTLSSPLTQFEVAGSFFYAFSKQNSGYEVQIFPANGQQRKRVRLHLDASVVSTFVFKDKLYILTCYPERPNQLYFLNGNTLVQITNCDYFGQLFMGEYLNHTYVFVAAYSKNKVQVINLEHLESAYTLDTRGCVDKMRLKGASLYLITKKNRDPRGVGLSAIYWALVHKIGDKEVSTLAPYPLLISRPDIFYVSDEKCYIGDRALERLHVIVFQDPSADTLEYWDENGKPISYRLTPQRVMTLLLQGLS